MIGSTWLSPDDVGDFVVRVIDAARFETWHLLVLLALAIAAWGYKRHSAKRS